MTRNMARKLARLAGGLSLALGVLWSNATFAEPLDYFLVDGVRYDPAVLKPHEVSGHDLGDQPTRHDVMVEYMRQLANQSPRMHIETIGYSHERRPILQVIVSHPDNLANRDAIQTSHVARLDGQSNEAVPDDMPVVTWLNYGVHGAEASGMDAVIPTLYHLAAARGADIEDQLRNSVILITAVFNPDGHSRRAAWVTQYRSDVVNRNPAHEIHNQVWPGGRTNHYWFDLNRQWLLQTQPESQAWLTTWHAWKPNVTGDFHEMGANATYYFHPGVPTRKFPLIPDQGRDLLVEISKYHAASLDKAKELYYTEESFDNFYVGKGSTYPQVQGGLGILYEAGAQMGLERESDQGIKTFARNIRTHMKTGLSTIKGAADMRERLLAYQQEFFNDAVADAAGGRGSGYVFRAPEDPTRVQYFIDLMNRHDVEVYPVTGSVKASGTNYGPESYVIPFAQPQYRLIRAMFERYTEFEDRIFYDVSGWTLPLAYGLEYGEVRGNLNGKIASEAAAPSFEPAATPDEAPYAYVFRWSDYYAPRALGRFLEEGVLVRTALNPIDVETTQGVKSFDRGAIIVSLDRQTVPLARIHEIAREVAEKDGLTVHAATSGLTPTVGSDLGGRTSMADLTMPNPLLIVGEGVSAYDAGEVWHQLDHRMKLPVTLVRKQRLKHVNFEDYTHIIMVGGGGSRLNGHKLEELKHWIEHHGGVLIASRQSAKWASEAVIGHKPTTGEPEAAPPRLTYADKSQKDAEHVIGGALYESQLDLAHPLAFGYARDRVATNRNTTIVLPTPKDPYARVAVYSEEPLLSGYSSDLRINEIKNTPMLTAERKGRGSVILFADNPNFRATYRGVEKLFLNALFFGKAFNSARRSEEEVDEGHYHTHVE